MKSEAIKVTFVEENFQKQTEKESSEWPYDLYL